MLRTSPSLKKLPDSPGVYFFLGPRKEVLYVGKATSLFDRVRSYFSSDLNTTRGPQLVQMVERAVRVDFTETDSVLEALILEAKLIKELKPRYNSRDKDDKSWNYLVITTNEPYPRLVTVRGKDLAAKLKELSGGDREQVSGSSTTNKRQPITSILQPHTSNLPVYGPFVHGGQFKEALKIIRKIFPYYDTTRPVLDLLQKNDARLRFNESIGIVPAQGTTPAEYAKTVRHITLIFEGKKKELLRLLARQMRACARSKRFEEAGVLKRQVDALLHIRDISLLRRDSDAHASTQQTIRIEGYDVAHLGGTSMVGVMTVVEGGVPVKEAYRTFNIRSVTKSNDTAALREVLTRRLAHPEWQYPRLMVVDGGKAQQRVATTVVREHGLEIAVVAVVKDIRHRPREILGVQRITQGREQEILLVNSEAHRFSLVRHTRRRAKSLVA